MPRKRKVVVEQPRQPLSTWAVIDKTKPRATLSGCRVIHRGLTLREAAGLAAEDDDYKIVCIEEDD